ncbi:MAG: helix-turn-helix transcriptional regulator [Burkholderiales bacterium]
MPSENDSEDGSGQPFSEFVADRVVAAIALAGMSIREMARRSGISAPRLHGRLHNERPFNTDELERIAVVLGVDPRTFVC